MPLKENTTQTGTDLNQIDVSKLALVDKTNLIDELTTKLKKGIELAFDEAIDGLGDKINAPSSQQFSSKSTSRTPRQPFVPSSNGLNEQEIKKQQAEFESLRKMKDRVDKQMERALARQRRDEKQQRERDLRGNVYSSKGVSHAQDIDEIVDQIHKADGKELQKLKEQVSMLRKNIELDTSGQEQNLLLKHADDLQRALIAETNGRKTVIGKIEHAFTKNAVNVASVVAGLTAHSPLAGLVTKYVLDKIQNAKEEREDRKNKPLKVTKPLMDTLPRRQESENKNINVSNENATQLLQSIDDQDQRMGLLAALHKGGHITNEQHEGLAKQFTPPYYTPLVDRIDRDRKMRMGQPVPIQHANQPGSKPTEEQVEARNHVPANEAPTRLETPGQRVKYGDHEFDVNDDWQKHLDKPKKVREQEEKLAWARMIGVRMEEKIQKQHEELQNRIKEMKPDDPSYNFMHDPDLVGDIRAPKPHKILGESFLPEHKAPVITMQKPQEREPMLQAALPVAPRETEAPQRVGPDDPAELKQEKAEKVTFENFELNKREQKELHGLHLDSEKLEKLSEQQLAELREINKNLKTQIDQSELGADAKRRETQHPGVVGSLGSDEGDKSKKDHEGGIISALLKERGLEKVLKIGSTGLLGLLKKIPGVGRLFGGGAKTAETVGGVSKVGEGVEAVSGVSKVGEGGLGILGKASKFAKLGDLAPWVLAVTTIIDFFSGFAKAEEFFGTKKKLTLLDRTAGGLAGVVKGIVGIVDLLLGFVGIKSHLGETFGKFSARNFRNELKIAMIPFKGMMLVIKMIGKVLGKIPWEKLAKFTGLEKMGDGLSKIFDVIDKQVDVLDSMLDFANDLLDGNGEATKKFKTALSEMLNMFLKPIDFVTNYIADSKIGKILGLKGTHYANSAPVPQPAGQSAPSTKSGGVGGTGAPPPAQPTKKPSFLGSIKKLILPQGESPTRVPDPGERPSGAKGETPSGSPTKGSNVLDGFVSSGNPALDEMMKAIAQQEGNGFKHNNPGNVMDYDYFKKTGQFKLRQFDSMGDGWKYLAHLLTTSKNYLANPANTFFDIFGKFAPKGHGGNDPVRYAKFVANKLGLDPAKSASVQLASWSGDIKKHSDIQLADEKPSEQPGGTPPTKVPTQVASNEQPGAAAEQPTEPSSKAEKTKLANNEKQPSWWNKTTAAIKEFTGLDEAPTKADDTKSLATISLAKLANATSNFTGLPGLVPAKPMAGANMTQASTENAAMKTASTKTGQSIIAPQTTVHQSTNNTTVSDLRADNRDNVYKRTMNEMFVST